MTDQPTPEQPPAPTEMEQLHDSVSTLQTIVNRVREAVGTDEPAAIRELQIRAEQAENLLRVAHETSNQAEVERAGAYRRAEEYEQERNQVAAVLAEVLRHFVHKGHPGEPCLSSGWVSAKTVDRWRSVVHHDVERPWWQQLDTMRAELERAQADIARYEEVQGEMNERAIDLTRRTERAEAAIARVRAECAALDRDMHGAEDDGMRTALNRILAALDIPPAHNTDPGIREAAADNRTYWEHKNAQEQP